MNIGLVYYSFSGNTRKVCDFLHARLAGFGHDVFPVEIKPEKEEKRFFCRGAMASGRRTPKLLNKELSVGRYDCVVFASPVWAFTFTPALRSFLRQCEGLENKACACFLTCGAAIASGNALKELEKVIADKGGRVFFSTYVTGSKAGDPEYLRRRFEGLFTGMEGLSGK